MIKRIASINFKSESNPNSKKAGRVHNGLDIKIEEPNAGLRCGFNYFDTKPEKSHIHFQSNFFHIVQDMFNKKNSSIGDP